MTLVIVFISTWRLKSAFEEGLGVWGYEDRGILKFTTWTKLAMVTLISRHEGLASENKVVLKALVNQTIAGLPDAAQRLSKKEYFKLKTTKYHGV